MAASMESQALYNSAIFCCFVTVLSAKDSLFQFQPQALTSAVESNCVFLVDIKADGQLINKFVQLNEIFSDDSVLIGSFDNGALWPSGNELHWKLSNLPFKTRTQHIAFFERKKIDRKCLFHPYENSEPSAEYFGGPEEVHTMVQFINSKCGTFRNPDGSKSIEGIHRDHILEDFYRMEDVSDVTMSAIYNSANNPLNKTRSLQKEMSQCEGSMCEDEATHENIYKDPNPVTLHTCDRIDLPLSRRDFLYDYVQRSKPVIISGAAKHWEAYEKWSNDFLKEKYSEKSVHIKLTPGGDFEGVEPIDLWEKHKEFKIPSEVYEKLKYPDLVVVRPAGVSMKFKEFLDLITWAAEQESRNVSAYLEYSSITEYMPELEEDLEEFSFAADLKLKHLNMWLSDGNTLGRLHFDPFDNLLCQLRGQKQVTMFEPYDNDRLYEAHIQQATLSYNSTGHRFRRSQLQESTSMVMSPVDVLNPDFERFPKFADVIPLNCTLTEGDVLYMPSFWWHEVKSTPNAEEKRNLAVNFWYEPFLTKEFPCPECKMDVNPFYYDLLG